MTAKTDTQAPTQTRKSPLAGRGAYDLTMVAMIALLALGTISSL